MKIRFNKTLGLFAHEAPLSDQRNRFRVWDASADPDSCYREAGWVTLTESEPVYDGSPVTGKLGYLANEDGTFTRTVGVSPWHEAIDEDVKKRQEAQAAIAQAAAASLAAGVPIKLPPGSLLDGADAGGQVVRCHLDGHERDGYWQGVYLAVQADKFTPKFDTMDGRVCVDRRYMETICNFVFDAKSPAMTAERDAKRLIEIGDTEAVMALVANYTLIGPPEPGDIEALYLASL